MRSKNLYQKLLRFGAINPIDAFLTLNSLQAPEKKGPALPPVDMYGNPLTTNRGPQGLLQIRILIPKIASGVLIGRQGSIIKQMSDLSSCKIQLGDEADPFETRERIVVINSSSVANVVLVSFNFFS